MLSNKIFFEGTPFSPPPTANHYAQYLCDLLNCYSKLSSVREGKQSFGYAALTLLKAAHLVDVVTIEDIQAFASGQLYPPPELQCIFNQLIMDRLHEPGAALVETIEYANDVVKYQNLPVAISPITPTQLIQRLFLIERDYQQMTQSDVAGMIGHSHLAVCRAETAPNLKENHLFESPRTIQGYSNNDRERAINLDRLVYRTLYPNGLDSLFTLTKFIAYRFHGSLPKMAEAINISDLYLKVSAVSGRTLTIAEKIQLRDECMSKLPDIAHLGIKAKDIDALLPSPLKAGDFSQQLRAWAELSSGNIKTFVARVAQKQGRTLAHNAMNNWVNGKGLQNNLEAIVQVLEESPKTRYRFVRLKDRFIQAALEAQPASHGHLNDSGKQWADRVQRQKVEPSINVI